MTTGRAMPATGDRAAAPTGQRGNVAPSRHLDEDGATGVKRGARGLQRHRRQPCAVRRRIAFLGESAVLQCDHPRCLRPHNGSGRHQIVRPPAAHHRLRLGSAGVSADHCGTAQLVCPQHSHFAGVRIRRARLGESVVAVVPHQHQPEVGDRSEYGAARSDDHARRTAQHRQPAAVSLRGTEAGRQRHHPAFVDESDDGVAQRVYVALVGHDRQHPATRPRRWPPRPRRAGLPTARPAAPARRPGRNGLRECGEKLLTSAVFGPSRGVDGRDSHRSGLDGFFFFDLGMPRRDRQPQHVGAGSCVARSDGVDQPTTSGVSTRSADSTLSNQPSFPTWSVSERRSRMNASTRRPWKRTRTRTPGCASSDCSAATR